MPTTVVDLLRRRVWAQPTSPGYTFLLDPPDGQPGDASTSALTYDELDRTARRIAVSLADRAVAGQPVLLLHPPGLDYVAAFLGCLYAGAVAVPAYPPEAARWHRTLPRLQALVADCGATVALTTAAVVDAGPAGSGSGPTGPELARLTWLATDRLPEGVAEDGWQPPASDPDAAALLQYTSGSTGAPRGVVLSHANLLHNAGLVQAGFGTTPETVGVSWLPPYHDMGLIGGILQPLYTGFPVVLMSPLTFLRRPLAWLETVVRAGATMTGGPNFAFDLCVRRTTAEQRAALDLTRWTVAFCGAEPVRAATLDRFAEAFAPAGFRRDAFYPCYGLAEATLIVTGGQPPRFTGEGRVGVGRPLGDQRLVIADPATGRPCPAGTEGEIWLAGPSVARGYWGRPDQTAATFQARLTGDPDRRYLRTGDLGYLDPAGELVVTGRIKDLIVVRGRNLHPADLEHAAQQRASGLRPGGTAAFPVLRDGVEQIGLACELAPAAEGDPAAVVPAVRQAVTEAADAAPAVVVLLRPGQLPKTSSGKIQRYACRRALEQGDWRTGAAGVLAYWESAGLAEPGSAPAGEGEHAEDGDDARVPALVAATLGTTPEAVPPGTPLTALGLDSLRAIELQGALETRIGIRVPLSDLLTGATTADLQSRAGSPDASAPVIENPTGAPRPSEGQRAMWLLQQWAPDSTAYQISRAARIRSPLDIPALARALQAVVARHPVLRTRMPARGGQPVIEVATPDDADLPVLAYHDLTGASVAELRERAQADADRRFDLARGPLLRASLFSRGPADHVLLLTLHHTITDFWSLSVLVDELLRHYTTGRPAGPPVAGYPVPRRSAGAGGHQQSLAYWREALAGAPPALELPTSFPRPRLQSFRGGTAQLRLPAAALRRLDALADETGVSRFTVLAAGYAAALARHAGQDEVVIGTPTADRDGRQHHSLGYLTNPVPLRVRVGPDDSLRDLALAVRRVLLGALDHPVPFATLVHALRPVRDPGRSPVVQAMLVLQQPPSGRPDLGMFAVADETAEFELAGLAVQPFRLAEHGAPFDLAVTFAEVAGELVGWVTYCADLFDPPAMARLLEHLSTLLTRAGAEPDRPLETIDLMDAAERAAVLATGQGPARPFPDRATLPELFARQVAASPAATAVVAGDRSLSYVELDRRAGALAAVLRQRYAVGPGSLVGVCAPRGPEAIVAFWAALQAGGTYLPLPPDHPPARLAWLLEDSRPAVVLTCRETAGWLPAGGPPRLNLDEPLPGPEPGGVPAAGTGPDDLAYVVYTSGSTGRPKGVMVGHRGACNLAAAEIDAFGITGTSRLLQVSAPAFDVHVADILQAHLAGAALYVPPPEATVPGPALAALLAEAQISFLCLTPSMLAALPDVALPDLTHVLVGGEVCPPELAARWAPGREFYNGYGPAETTVCVTWGRCWPGQRRRPPIGRPIQNVSAYVLDSRMQPVPVGIPGELYIGGVCVGQGYLHRPGLTAQRFLPDPFGSAPRGRLYRTGDRVRWLPDGSLDFLGRFDDQVKIRGVRVEPGEVEARLRELSGSREVAVVPSPEQAGSGAGPAPAGAAGLVAYLVAAPQQQRRSPAELRAALRAELPEPWVPVAFVHLAELPRGPSGKLDRRALPPPSPADRGLVGDRLAPRDELERVTARVWATVLGQAEVGVRDHFFDELGGSSLVVARVTSELSRELDREIPVTWLFEHPTVEALARRLAASDPDTRPGQGVTGGRDPEGQAARRRRALARHRRPADHDGAPGA